MHRTIDFITGSSLWVVNINDEEKVWKKQGFKLPRIHFSPHDRRIKGMDQLSLLTAKPGDVVVINEFPSRAYSESLQEWGLANQIILEAPDNFDKVASTCSKMNIKNYVPYLVTEWEEEIAKKLDLQLYGPPATISLEVNSKINARRLAIELGFQVPQGAVCNSLQEFQNIIKQLTSRIHSNNIVIKQPYGAAGKGLYIVKDSKQLELFSSRLARVEWINPFIVEMWLKTKVDFNVQLFVSQNETRILSVSKQAVDDGVYKGSIFSSEFERYFRERYQSLYIDLGQRLAEMGYRGIAGVDGIITEEQGIYPCLEINGRFTQTTYLFPIINDLILPNNQLCRTIIIDVKEAAINYETLRKSCSEIWINSDYRGIWIFNEACLPTKDQVGRIFALISANTDKEMMKFYQMLLSILSELNLL